VGLSCAGTLFAAAAKPSWQATWEKTVAAAKKEGKLNFYVGRYGAQSKRHEGFCQLVSLAQKADGAAKT
jgi:hypothetical protein